MAPAFYLPEDGVLVPTELTRGPWRHDAQHGGPPMALVGRALEHCEPRPGMRLVRVTTEILGPVPLEPLRVEAAVTRPGRNVELLEATLGLAGGRDLLRARAWRIRTAGSRDERGEERGDERVLTPTEPLDGPPPPPPGRAQERPFFPGAANEGWHTGMEIRFLAGGFLEPGPARVWFRLRRPLVAGEEPTPLQRLLVAADAANGVSSSLEFERYVFINTDLSVHVLRQPAGEWVHLDARTVLGGDGTGASDTLLSDHRGVTARGLQSLLVMARP